MVDNDGQPDPLVLNLSKYYTSPSKRGKSPVRRVVKKQKMANLNNNDLFGTSTAASVSTIPFPQSSMPLMF